MEFNYIISNDCEGSFANLYSKVDSLMMEKID
jgi:hypothetical protein